MFLRQEFLDLHGQPNKQMKLFSCSSFILFTVFKAMARLFTLFTLPFLRKAAHIRRYAPPKCLFDSSARKLVTQDDIVGAALHDACG